MNDCHQQNVSSVLQPDWCQSHIWSSSGSLWQSVSVTQVWNWPRQGCSSRLMWTKLESCMISFWRRASYSNQLRQTLCAEFGCQHAGSWWYEWGDYWHPWHEQYLCSLIAWFRVTELDILCTPLVLLHSFFIVIHVINLTFVVLGFSLWFFVLNRCFSYFFI